MKTRWPWISMLLAAILTLSPPGLEIIDATFFSAETLSRGIWGPIALVIIAIMALVILVELLIRTLILNRRDRSATAA